MNSPGNQGTEDRTYKTCRILPDRSKRSYGPYSTTGPISPIGPISPMSTPHCQSSYALQNVSHSFPGREAEGVGRWVEGTRAAIDLIRRPPLTMLKNGRSRSGDTVVGRAETGIDLAEDARNARPHGGQNEDGRRADENEQQRILDDILALLVINEFLKP